MTKSLKVAQRFATVDHDGQPPTGIGKLEEVSELGWFEFSRFEGRDK